MNTIFSWSAGSFIILILFLIFIPIKKEVTKIIDVGATINAITTRDTFGYNKLTRVETEDGSFVLDGIVSIYKNKKSFIRVFNNGERCLKIDGINDCFLLYGI